MGRMASNPFLKLRLFPSSLSGVAFTWYYNLTPNSITSWEEMEEEFHAQFYVSDREVSMGDLAGMKQNPGETVVDFLKRFKLAKNRCRIRIPELQCVQLALNGLNIDLRMKFESCQFANLYDMESRIVRYEELLEEKRRLASTSSETKAMPSKAHKANIHVMEYGELEKPAWDIMAVAEVATKGPYTCDELARANSGRKIPGKDGSDDEQNNYTFDLSKAEQIFDSMHRDGALLLKGGQRIPSPEELKGKPYCKYHNSTTHSTNNCRVWRKVIQNLLNTGVLRFSERKMGIDKEPFPSATNVSQADVRQMLNKPKQRDRYTFNTDQSEQIFDFMLREKALLLKPGHIVQKGGSFDGQSYCKYHNTSSHITRECTAWKQLVQSFIDAGTLQICKRSGEMMLSKIGPKKEIRWVRQYGQTQASKTMPKEGQDLHVETAKANSSKILSRQQGMDKRPSIQNLIDSGVIISSNQEGKKESLSEESSASVHEE